MRKLSDFKRVIFLMSVVLIIPIFIRVSPPTRASLDPNRIAQIESEQPELILIGNSNLDFGIDQSRLRKLIPNKKIGFIIEPGTTSLYWYLVFKNFILSSKWKPKAVGFLFIDRNLTKINETLEYRLIQTASLDREPLVETLLGYDHFLHQFSNWIKKVYPVQYLRPFANDIIDLAAVSLAGVKPDEIFNFKNQLADLFSLKNSRNDIPRTTTTTKEINFNDELSKSLLPDLIKLAHDAGIKLIFLRHRVKPDKNTNLSPQSEALKKYIYDLSSYLKNENQIFIDFTDTAELTHETYLGQDHLNTIGKEILTKKLADALRNEIP